MDNAERIKKFAQSTSFTSGKLCSRNIFCISEKEFADSMQIKQDERIQKMNEKEQRLEQIKQKKDGKFLAAAQKYFDGKHLLVDDLKSILKETSVKGDSPLGKKVDDLRLQFDRRKDRMMKYSGAVPPNRLFAPPIPPPPAQLFVADIVESTETTSNNTIPTYNTPPQSTNERPFSIDHLFNDDPTTNSNDLYIDADEPTTNTNNGANIDNDGVPYSPNNGDASCFSLFSLLAGTCTEQIEQAGGDAAVATETIIVDDSISDVELNTVSVDNNDEQEGNHSSSMVCL
jgi:hypothetical protein